MATERRTRISDYVGPKVTVHPDDLDKLEASGEWVFETKMDGFWCLATVDSGVLVQMASRVGLAFEGAECGDLLGRRIAAGGTGRLVGELTADAVNGERAGTRRLHLFEILDWNGHDLRDLPQVERREALAMVYGSLAVSAIRDAEGLALILLVEQRTTGIRAWFDEIIAGGGEGIVAKRRDAVCRAKNGDGKIEAWVRAKKKRCVDYLVVGHGVAEKGTPTLDLGLWKKGKLVKVCTVVLPPEWRAHPPESYVGKVVEAAGWEIFPSGALRHAQIGHRPGPRTDKLATDCTIESAQEA